MATPGLLLTDLYELTMLEAYRAEHMNGRATFEFFVRALPAGRGFLVAAGLAQFVDYLTTSGRPLAAPRRVLVDFGLRRAHGAEAGLLSARATYLGGFTGTATVEAGRAFGIPVFGTMAHSYVQAHADEASAFEAFVRARPGNATLLIDTYDTERAACKVVALTRRLAAEGLAIQGVRIDSGDLATDYCILNTVGDAIAAGFAAVVLSDGIRAVDVHPVDGANAEAQMRRAGARFARTRDVAGACAPPRS